MGLFDFFGKKKTTEPTASASVPMPEEPRHVSEGEMEMSTGARPSPKDARDVPYSALVGSAAPETLPKVVEVDVSKLPVWHQRKIGSCVGHAAAKYKQLLDLLETGEVIPLSPRFLYALAKCRDGYADEGTYPRLVAKILKDHGCATERSVPNKSTLSHEEYVYQRDEKNLPAGAFEDAAPYKIGGYAFPNIRSIYELKKAVLRDNGAIILMRLGKEWYTDKKGKSSWDDDDIIPLRAPTSGIVSGHEVYLYKIETVTEDGRERNKCYVFNSWSADWGAKGKAWFYHDEYLPYLDEAITFTDLPNRIIEAVKKMPEAKDFAHNFEIDIKEGDRGAEVVALQTFLMFTGDFSRELYSELLRTDELGYFKPKGVTARAVLLFQLRQNVGNLDELCALKGSVFGSKSRQAANAIITSGGLTK